MYKAEYEAAFPLHHNIIVGNAESVSRLLECDIDVNQPDKEGNTPLHYATLHGGREIIQLLLGKKADPLSKNNYGRTPKDLAEGDAKELLEEAINKKHATNSLFRLCTTHMTTSSSLINERIKREVGILMAFSKIIEVL